MDDFIDNRETETNSKHELYLFYSTVASFENLLFTRQNISILVIIGQRDILHSLDAISELTHIQELWIVECGIKEIPLFKQNCPLKKLYLYSNEISCISNLEVCSCLTTLFLSGNNICSLQSLDKLTLLEELNLANNRLKKIDKSSFKKSEIRYLNLAGNHLSSIRKNQNCLNNEAENDLQSIISEVELNKRQFLEKKQMAITQFKIFQQQLIFDMDYCGNINFVEYNATTENMVIELCKQFLEGSLCSVIKQDLGITGLKIHKVTEVRNKEINCLNVCKEEFEESLESDECNIILKILISPGVTDIQSWPINFFKHAPFNKNKLMVTNCLAIADADWLHKVSLMMENGKLSSLNVCERRRVCILMQTSIFGSTNK
ncbi:protein phosphatase 1 regulatory subunit 42-like [Colletes gigas]|uniref:protein phosphatase 1 regulatory subunit 42-like n=1 Tax=Colletes gigas TaxID=935657 RepID=UPI001C9A404C|nr:protein phosphatase 1 regulatory subunit 42-like [Colletes gigas]